MTKEFIGKNFMDKYTLSIKKYIDNKIRIASQLLTPITGTLRNLKNRNDLMITSIYSGGVSSTETETSPDTMTWTNIVISASIGSIVLSLGGIIDRLGGNPLFQNSSGSSSNLWVSNVWSALYYARRYDNESSSLGSEKEIQQQKLIIDGRLCYNYIRDQNEYISYNKTISPYSIAYNHFIDEGDMGKDSDPDILYMKNHDHIKNYNLYTGKTFHTLIYEQKYSDGAGWIAELTPGRYLLKVHVVGDNLDAANFSNPTFYKTAWTQRSFGDKFGIVEQKVVNKLSTRTECQIVDSDADSLKSITYSNGVQNIQIIGFSYEITDDITTTGLMQTLELRW